MNPTHPVWADNFADMHSLIARLTRGVCRLVTLPAQARVLFCFGVVQVGFALRQVTRKHDISHSTPIEYRLRQKLEADPAQPKHFLTELGLGYRFHI